MSPQFGHLSLPATARHLQRIVFQEAEAQRRIISIAREWALRNGCEESELGKTMSWLAGWLVDLDDNNINSFDFNIFEVNLSDSSEQVSHPSHYLAEGRKECIVEMEEKFGIEKVKAFCELNAYKYRYRAEMKNGEEDIKKAEWYENRCRSYDK